ncbi:MAG: DUF1254 domain-containing protein [Dehalococcoidia bacterium]
MKRWIIWTGIGTVIVAIVAHLITPIIIPIIIMNIVMNKVPPNVLMRATKTTPEVRTVVMPSADLVYSLATYDVSQEPVLFSAVVPSDSYWSMALYQENTRNFFVINDSQVKSNPVKILITKAGTQATAIPDAENVQVVMSPANKGLLLIRHLLTSDDKFLDLIKIQRQASLTPVSRLRTSDLLPECEDLLLTDAYNNTEYGFSINYPKSWIVKSPSDKNVFVATSPAKSKTIIISVRDEDSISTAINAILGESITNIKIASEKEVKLEDGTMATQAVLEFKAKDGHMEDSLASGIQKNGKYIVVMLNSVNMDTCDEVQFSKILQTFKLTK